MSNEAQNEEDLAVQVAYLSARLAELEERVARLESSPASNVRSTAGPVEAAPALGNEELAAAISQALAQLEEGDTSAIRQQMIKNGQPTSLGRSDVNKMLYNRKDLFQVVRQEGAKPIWKPV